MSARMILSQSNGGILKKNKIYFGIVYREFLCEKQDFKDKDLSRKYLVSTVFPLPPFLKSTNISVAEISQGLLLVSGSVQPIMTSFSSSAFTRSHKGLWEIICSSKVHCVIHAIVLGSVYGF